MLSAAKRLALLVLGFLGIAAIAQLVSSYLFACYDNHYQLFRELDYGYYCFSFGPLPVYDILAWYGSFFEKTTDLIVATFTIIIAISTIFLWLATHVNAQAALQTADVARRALVDLERPYVFEIIESHKESVSGSGFGPQKFEIHVIFKNHGKMPAIIKEAVIDIKQFRQLPGSINTYGEMVSTSDPPVLGSGAFIGPISRTCNLTEADMLDHQQDQLSVWIFGRVAYTDLAGNRFENEFRWVYNRSLSCYEEKYRRHERKGE